MPYTCFNDESIGNHGFDYQRSGHRITTIDDGSITWSQENIFVTNVKEPRWTKKGILIEDGTGSPWLLPPSKFNHGLSGI
jgi:hypothetical protein